MSGGTYSLTLEDKGGESVTFNRPVHGGVLTILMGDDQAPLDPLDARTLRDWLIAGYGYPQGVGPIKPVATR